MPVALPPLCPSALCVWRAQGHVFIKHAGRGASPDDAYAKLKTEASDDVADLVMRACREFPRWGTDAGQVRLYLVVHAPGGDEPTAEAETAALESRWLQSGWTLERASVIPGSWLLARVALPAAAAGASFGREDDISPIFLLCWVYCAPPSTRAH